MGPVGSGKTSVSRSARTPPVQRLRSSQFINLAQGFVPQSMPGGFRTEVQISETINLNGRRVRLIDTPGFQNDARDADVLQTTVVLLEAT